MRIRYHKRKKEVINLHAHELGTFPAQDWRHLEIFIRRLMTAKSMEERGSHKLIALAWSGRGKNETKSPKVKGREDH